MEDQHSLVDQSQIKFSMAATALLLIFGYVLDYWIFVAVAATFQVLAAVGGSVSPFNLIYTKIILPAKLLKPNPMPDHHAPHKFASFIGGLFNFIGIIFLFNGMYLLGWLFIAFVFLLTLLNLFLNFCAGCFTYYMMNKLSVPGFVHSRVKTKS